MNLIFTCGGTAGHINPAIAIANHMKENHPDCKVLFIGAEGHMEETLVPKAGYELRVLPGSGLSRKLNLHGIKQNIYAVNCVLGAVKQCKKIFKEFKPDAVIGTGGYASFPALYAAQKMGIPTCVHESNAVPGITTKLAAKKADRVLVAVEESRGYYKNPERVEVVGMPVREEFIYLKKKDARKDLGLDERPLVVSAFGSPGAKVMTETMAEVFRLEKEAGYPFQHIHATGSFGCEWMPELVKEKGVDLSQNQGIDMREYIYDMPTVMTAADVIISRAGAATCNEIGICGTPDILVPSPNVTHNHQEKNAHVLADRDAAVLLLEQDCTPEIMYEQITGLLADKARRKEMSHKLQELVRVDSTQRIGEIVESLTRR